MKITIITVNYNGSKTLSRTIESILNQGHNDIEYIIIDGKSTDNSLEIIKKYENKFRDRGYEYKWISEKDTGIYNAMNKGIKMAKGNVIGILNSDDWYEKESLEIIAKEFEKDESIGIVYGLLRTIKNNKYHEIVGNYNSYGNGQHPTVFVKKIIYDNYGYFNEKYKIASDSDFLLKLKNNKIKYKFIEKILANFSIEGISNKAFLKTNLENIEIFYKNNIYTRKEKNLRIIYIYLVFFIKKILKR